MTSLHEQTGNTITHSHIVKKNMLQQDLSESLHTLTEDQSC